MAQVRPFQLNKKIVHVKEEDVFSTKDLTMRAGREPFPESRQVKLRLALNTTFKAGDRISITPNYHGVIMSDNYCRNIWYDEDRRCLVTEVVIERRLFEGKDYKLKKDEAFGKICLKKSL